MTTRATRAHIKGKTPSHKAPQKPEPGSDLMSAEATQQRSAAKLRAAIFAVFALIATAITTTVQGVEGNFAFWIDRVGGSQVGFSIPVVLLWATL